MQNSGGIKMSLNYNCSDYYEQSKIIILQKKKFLRNISKQITFTFFAKSDVTIST